ncbi:hypothetical protein [Flavobacterium luteum]|uniref:Beta-carotene 15,15'-monooxygenase n=1 Tax=Flavobacterium luteum TaxID=2026654 RepID=A0A7J5AJ02_9FLAO|nr:hypothetical protein [Flavobacterium luteum]KAB1157556.1 hypothetical protein F6464_00275 [Flavobacterium luteum]
MENVNEKIAAIQEHGYEIDFGTIFNKAIENYKKIALIAGLTFILFSIIIVALFIGVFTAFWGFSTITENMSQLEPKNFSGTTVLIYTLSISIFAGITAPFSAGILKMAYKASKNEEFSVSTAFDYYKSDFLKDLFIATTIVSIFSLGISTVLESSGIRFIGALLSYAISFFNFLTIPLIIFGKIPAFEAIKGSFTIVSKQVFVLLALLIVSAIMACLGLIGFCIGIFFTFPFMYSMYFIIYNEIIGIDEKSELEAFLE